MGSVYYEFAVLVMVAAVVGAFALRLRQPLVMMHQGRT